MDVGDGTAVDVVRERDPDAGRDRGLSTLARDGGDIGGRRRHVWTRPIRRPAIDSSGTCTPTREPAGVITGYTLTLGRLVIIRIGAARWCAPDVIGVAARVRFDANEEVRLGVTHSPVVTPAPSWRAVSWFRLHRPASRRHPVGGRVVRGEAKGPMIEPAIVTAPAHAECAGESVQEGVDRGRSQQFACRAESVVDQLSCRDEAATDGTFRRRCEVRWNPSGHRGRELAGVERRGDAAEHCDAECGPDQTCGVVNRGADTGLGGGYRPHDGFGRGGADRSAASAFRPRLWQLGTPNVGLRRCVPERQRAGVLGYSQHAFGPGIIDGIWAGVEWVWAVPQPLSTRGNWPSNRCSPMWSFRRNGPGDHNIGRVWVVSIASGWCPPASVAPVAGNAYTDEIRLCGEASREPELSQCDRMARSAPIEESPGCSVRYCGGQHPIDGLPSDVEDFLPAVSVNALGHPRRRIGSSDLWSACRRAGEAGFGGTVGGVA